MTPFAIGTPRTRQTAGRGQVCARIHSRDIGWFSQEQYSRPYASVSASLPPPPRRQQPGRQPPQHPRTRTTPASCAMPRPTPRARAASRSPSTAAKFARVGARRAQAEVHRLPRGCLGRQAPASREAEAGQLRDLPREGGQGVRGHRARRGAQGRQCRRRHLHRLPRHARHQAGQGGRFAHESRERRGHLRQVPRQRCRRGQGQASRRQHRQQVPRQHPRQGAQGRGAGLGAHVHELPRGARHPRQDPKRTAAPAAREDPRHLRQLPQEGARGVRQGHARQAAAGGRARFARMHGLPQRARDPAARQAVRSRPR